MSNSIPDKIIIKGKHYRTDSQPLKEFEEEIKEILVTSDFVFEGFEREYVAHWEIVDRKLYLIDIKIISDEKLSSVFPEGKERILANWFSGEIVVEREKSHIATILRDFHFKKKHHYIFKEGIQIAFFPIDYITKKKPGDNPFNIHHL